MQISQVKDFFSRGGYMKIRDAIKKWPNLNWGGSFDGLDRTGSPDPATTVIKDVSDRSGRDGNKIWIDAEADNQPVSDKRPVGAIVFFRERAVFDRVFNALNSAIGKSLDEAGDVDVPP
jgi:hypothetical protein